MGVAASNFPPFGKKQRQGFCWGKGRKEANRTSACFSLGEMALGNSAPAAQTPLASSINRLQWVCWAIFFPLNEVKMLYLCVYSKAGSTVHVQGLAGFPHPSAFGQGSVCARLWGWQAAIPLQQCTFRAAFKGLTSPPYRTLYFTANLLFDNKWCVAVPFPLSPCYAQPVSFGPQNILLFLVALTSQWIFSVHCFFFLRVRIFY